MSEFEKSTSLKSKPLQAHDSSSTKEQLFTKKSSNTKSLSPSPNSKQPLLQKQSLKPVVSLQPTSCLSSGHLQLQSQLSILNPLHDLETCSELVLRHDIGIVKDKNAGEVYDPYTQRIHQERRLITEEQFVLINKDGFRTLYVASDQSTECQKILFRGSRKFSIDVDGQHHVPKFEIERVGVSWNLFKNDEIQKMK